RWDVRVAIREKCPFVAQDLYDVQCRRLPHIVHAGLVSHSEDVDAGTAHALALTIERLGDLLHHEARHALVDVPRQLDEARLEPVHLRLPGEVEGIDRNAVPAEPGAGVEG